MCLILFAHGAHPEYPLVIAANRDEYYQRPTSAASFWKDHPQILAGRDLEGGGTWLGVTRQGRFAALTNFRGPAEHKPDAPTRGRLVSDFLLSRSAPREYLEQVRTKASRYNGFSLLLGDMHGIFYYCSREAATQMVPAGIYGLSNHLLDTPWPKVEQGKTHLAHVLKNGVTDDLLLQLLDDRSLAADAALPDTGVGLERERILSAALIVSPQYGTRASTAVMFDRGGNVSFTERTVLPNGIHGESVSYRFTVGVASAA
jgi:uncharacterized protein with NRDE domain